MPLLLPFSRAQKQGACGSCSLLQGAPHSTHTPPRSAPCSYGREECVKLLLAAGADITATNDKGQNAAEVVKSEPRNPLNQNAALLAVLEGAAELASIQ